MSAPNDAAEDPPVELIDRIKAVAAALGVYWGGLGGARRERLKDGRFVWRVHDDWLGFGGYADVDAVSGELLHLEETGPEREGPPLIIPSHRVPDEHELIAFAREKFRQVGWNSPDAMAVSSDESRQVWHLAARDAREPLWIDIGGSRGRLHVIRVSRL
jgi:hypothetical protein